MKKLVIARICGGLGNQVFIYAMARRLAFKNDVPLKLDIVSGFTNDRYCRKYLLKYFNIQSEIANPYESFGTRIGQIRRRVLMKLAQLRKFDNRPYIIEENRRFDPRILNLKIKQKVYLQGLWQSECYFKDVEHIIRQDLEIIKPHDFDTIKMAKRIQDINSISLHVRSYHEVPKKDGAIKLSIDYYMKALERIAQEVESPHFFCFSDNPDWVKQNFSRIEFPVTFVTHNISAGDDKAHEDLWLMRQCKHHIVANSSFSWWGAWLNKNPEKIVIAPKGEFYNQNYFPQAWIKL